jgi:hypothetical protein
VTTTINTTAPVFRRAPQRRWPLLLAVGGIAVLVATGAAVGSLVGGSPGRGKANATSQIHHVKVSDPVVLPAGYGSPVALTVDRSTNTVWFLDANSSSEAIFQWNPASEQLHQFIIGSPSSLPYGIQAGMAVDPSGNVWVGIDSTLIEWKASTATTVDIPLPSAPLDSQLVGGPGGVNGVPSLYSTHAISGLVVDGSGDIAISRAFSTALLFYNPTTATFSSLSLPGNGVPTGISSVTTGGVAVASSGTHSVDIVNPSQSAVTQLPSATAYRVACDHGFCAVPANLTAIQILSPPTTGSELSSSTSQNGWSMRSVGVSATAGAGGKLQVGSEASPLASGKVIVPTTAGFAVVNATSGATTQYPFAASACPKSDRMAIGNVIVGKNADGANSSSSSCRPVPQQYVVDGSGNVWFTTNGGTGEILEMSAGSF